MGSDNKDTNHNTVKKGVLCLKCNYSYINNPVMEKDPSKIKVPFDIHFNQMCFFFFNKSGLRAL